MYADAPDDAFAAITIRIPDNVQAQGYLAELFRTPAHTAEEVMYRIDSACFLAEDPFVRADHMVQRLTEDALLNSELREVYEADMRDNLDDTVAAFALRDHTVGLDALADLGMLDAANIDHTIDVASRAGAVASCSYLLEMKTRRFKAGRRSFSL